MAQSCAPVTAPVDLPASGQDGEVADLLCKRRPRESRPDQSCACCSGNSFFCHVAITKTLTHKPCVSCNLSEHNLACNCITPNCAATPYSSLLEQKRMVGLSGKRKNLLNFLHQSQVLTIVSRRLTVLPTTRATQFVEVRTKEHLGPLSSPLPGERGSVLSEEACVGFCEWGT